MALSREMAEMTYDVDYYVHVRHARGRRQAGPAHAVQRPRAATEQLNAYAGPVVEQAINQLIQVTPLEQVNEKIHDLTELVRSHLQEFLGDLRHHAQHRQGAGPPAPTRA